MKFSLIIATFGRKQELFEMLQSVQKSDFNLNNIEIIIVDQNKTGFLDSGLLEFNGLNIKHIHSHVKGLSYNRNIGLKYISGDVICFPDDDCLFYQDTLNAVSNILSSSRADFCMGQIYDRDARKDVIRKWSKKYFEVHKLNSYFINSSITLFVKKEWVLNFDENLGVGAKFGSCEDADLIYRILESGAKGRYSPDIQLWHPQPNYQGVSLDKVRSYASGFGYFVRKNTDYIKVLLLILLIGKKSLQLVSNVFNKKFQDDYFYNFFEGLFLGLKSK